MAMRRSRGARSLASSPSSRMAPELGSSSPATMRRTVDLPHPDGPRSTMNSPSPTSRLTLSTATVPSGNTFVTSLSATVATPSPPRHWRRSQRRPRVLYCDETRPCCPSGKRAILTRYPDALRYLLALNHVYPDPSITTIGHSWSTSMRRPWSGRCDIDRDRGVTEPVEHAGEHLPGVGGRPVGQPAVAGRLRDALLTEYVQLLLLVGVAAEQITDLVRDALLGGEDVALTVIDVRLLQLRRGQLDRHRLVIGGIGDVTQRDVAEVDVGVPRADADEDRAVVEDHVRDEGAVLLDVDDLLEVTAGRLEPGQVLDGQQQGGLATVGGLLGERVVGVRQQAGGLQAETDDQDQRDQAGQPEEAAGRATPAAPRLLVVVVVATTAGRTPVGVPIGVRVGPAGAGLDLGKLGRGVVFGVLRGLLDRAPLGQRRTAGLERVGCHRRSPSSIPSSVVTR